MKQDSRANHFVYFQALSGRLVWLEVRQENGTSHVLSAGVQPMGEPESSDEDSPSGPVTLKDAMKALQSQLKLGWMARPHVVVFAPSHRFTTRFVDTPPVEEETLRDLVGFEVSEALQVPLDHIAWDMLLSSGHGEEAKKQLLWMAARREFVDEMMNAWPLDRLTPTQLTPDFWAYYEFLLGVDSSSLQQPTLLVTREGDRACITLADRRAIYLTRSVPLNRPLRVASDLQGSDSEEFALAAEIERTLYYAADRFAQGAIKGIICFGFEEWPLERMEQMAENNHLRFAQVTLQNVVSAFTVNETVLLPVHLPMLCMAYCQGQRKITGPNLLEISEEKIDWKSYIPEAALPSQKFVTLAGSLFGVLLVLWIGKAVWFNSAVQSRLQAGDDLLKLAGHLQREESGLRQLTHTHVDLAGLFLFLAKTLPDGMLVKTLNLDIQSGVELALKGGNNQQAVDVQKQLNESPYFKDLVLDRAVVEKEGFTIYMKGKLVTGR